MDIVSASQPRDRGFEPTRVTTMIPHMAQWQYLLFPGSGLESDLNKM